MNPDWWLSGSLIAWSLSWSCWLLASTSMRFGMLRSKHVRSLEPIIPRWPIRQWEVRFTSGSLVYLDSRLLLGLFISREWWARLLHRLLLCLWPTWPVVPRKTEVRIPPYKLPLNFSIPYLVSHEPSLMWCLALSAPFMFKSLIKIWIIILIRIR